MVDLGARLKILRKQKNMTQEQLANRIGLTKSVISAYESGARCPSYEILIKLTNIFNVSTDYLLGVRERNNIDVSALTPENARLISSLVDALGELHKNS